MTFAKQDAVEILNQYVRNKKMLDHWYVFEAVMRALTCRLGQDEDK